MADLTVMCCQGRDGYVISIALTQK